MGVVKEKNTNTRPARAGFAQLAPKPPNTHFATKIAKALARKGMNNGTEGLIFKPTNKPVRKAEPSHKVDSLLTFPSKNSQSSELEMATAKTRAERKPNT